MHDHIHACQSTQAVLTLLASSTTGIRRSFQANCWRCSTGGRPMMPLPTLPQPILPSTVLVLFDCDMDSTHLPALLGEATGSRTGSYADATQPKLTHTAAQLSNRPFLRRHTAPPCTAPTHHSGSDAHHSSNQPGDPSCSKRLNRFRKNVHTTTFAEVHL
jgi:hypothetical protein